MRKIFPQAQIRFCQFHLAKSVFTQIQKKGILPLYEDPESKTVLRSFAALALLPVEEVPDAFDELCNTLRNRLEEDQIPATYENGLRG